MKPVMCQVKDDPERGLYGDCVRACVASMLEMEAEDVPHFFHDGEAEECHMRMQTWLAERGMIAAFIGLPGHWSFDRLTAHMIGTYRNQYYMLWCGYGGGDHAVIGRNCEIVHNPAWYATPMTGPHSSGMWIVILIARLT